MPRRLPGTALNATAAILFALAASLGKLASEEVPPVEVVLVRSAITLGAVVLVEARAGRGEAPLLGRRPSILALRGVLGGVALVLYFQSLAGLPVANAVLLAQTAPLWVIGLGATLLGEPVGGRTRVAAPVAFLGVALLLGPGAGFPLVPSLIGLLSAALAGGAYVAVRQLRAERPWIVVGWFAGLSILLSAPLTWAAGPVAPSGPVWVALLAVGLLSVGAQLLMTEAYRREEAGRVAVVGWLGPLFAAGMDVLVWGRWPHWSTLAGAVLVVGAIAWMQRAPGAGGGSIAS